MEKEQYNDVLKDVQDYMINNNYIERALKYKMIKNEKKTFSENVENVEKNVENVKNVEESIYVPNQQDTLFWCYYIIVNGYTAYEMLHNKNLVIAKQMKIDLVLLIRKHKDILKIYKFDTITNIESNLANDHCINIKTFFALCAISNLNIMYINKKTYFEFFMNDTSNVYIITNGNGSKYGYQIASDCKIDETRKNFYKLDKMGKPMKALSGYKVEELVNMCEKLAIESKHISTGKTKSKKELYESIIQYF
jgi:hypothetical protein